MGGLNPVSSSLVPARLSRTPDGTPISETYGDIYHSADGGPEQARCVFLEGNGLPARWQGRDNFTILEIGFGLGLNFLASWLLWRNDPQRSQSLRFISLEKHPFSANDLRLAHAVWPEFSDLSARLCARWPSLEAGKHLIRFEEEGEKGTFIDLELVLGDAVETLPHLEGAVDAFYLDGFSPAKNPDLWSPFVCQHLARLANPHATLATWSVAGQVRRALVAAGFAVERRPGFAGKRQRLTACR